MLPLFLMKEKPLPDVLPLLKEAIDHCAQETAPAYLQNKAFLEENATLYYQIQEMYTRSQHLRTDVAVNNQKLRNAYQSLQRKIDELLPALARAFARRDDAFYDLEDAQFQENFIRFYEQQKPFFEDPKNARDPAVVANLSLVIKYQQERELRKKAEKRGEQKLIESWQNEMARPLTLAIILQPANLLEALQAVGKQKRQKYWEDDCLEVYVPLFWERRDSGLMNNLNRALLEAIPLESNLIPREYQGIMQIELHHDYDALHHFLQQLQPKDFDKANITLQILSVKEMIHASNGERREKKKRRFL